MKKKLTAVVIAGDLNPSDLGGAEVHIVEVIKGLAERGHAMHVFCGRDTDIQKVVNHPNIVWHAVPYRRIKNLYFLTYTWAVVREVSRFLKQNPHVDLIHAKAVFPFGIAAARLAKRFKKPFYQTVQNPLAYKEELVIKARWLPAAVKRWIQESLRPLARYALKHATLAACVSRYAETESKKLGARHTVIVPNGFDPARFYPKPTTSKEEFWITTTSTLIPRNGIDTLVEAFALISPKHPDARLKIAGEGPMRAELDRTIKDHSIESKVEFLGTLTHDQIPQLLNRSHLFVRPSRFEGFGVSFIEAMACGVAVVTCPRGGITDFVTHDQTGKLVQPDDPRALADTMESLMRNQEERLRLAEQGRALVEERYAWPRIIEKVEELYYSTAVGR